MSRKRTHFPRTTPDQRRLLFEAWQATKNITRACEVAHVSRQTFYDWRPRFEADGFAGLLNFARPIAKNLQRIAPVIEQQVTEMRQQNPSWGKRRIADEMTKANQWVPLVTPNTVRRILQDAGLWSALESMGKKKMS